MDYELKMQELMADYQRQCESLAQVQRKIDETVGTAVAPRQAAKVTVDASGAVTELEFPTGAYKNMAPKELADMLLAVLKEAHENAVRAVTGIVGEQQSDGESIADMLGGQEDFKNWLSQDSFIPAEVRELLGFGPGGTAGGDPAAKEDSWPTK